MRRPALVALLLIAAAPAVAQDRPPLTPTRDVGVTYRFVGGGAQGGPPGMPGGGPGMQNMQMSWNAAQGLLRSEMPGIGWMVADQRNGRAFMVMEAMRSIMDVPLPDAARLPGQSPTSTFRREGTATVAGLPCTNWAFQDGASQGRACITADGVMLRAEGATEGRSGGLEATQVTYGPQDPARFQRPAGYQTMQMPQGIPGMPGAAPGQRPPAPR